MNFADVLLPIKPCPHQPLPPAQSGPTSQQGFFRFFTSTYFFVIRMVSTCPLALSNQLILLFLPLCSSLVVISFPHHFLICFPSLASFVSPLQSPSSANQRKTSFPHSFLLSLSQSIRHGIINLTNTKQTAGVTVGQEEANKTHNCVCACVCHIWQIIIASRYYRGPSILQKKDIFIAEDQMQMTSKIKIM